MGNHTTNGHPGKPGNGRIHANGHTNGHGPRFAVPPIETDDRLPPHNLEAEQGALGGMILDNDQVPGVLAILTDEDFYRDSHQKIFRAIKATWERLGKVDLILLHDELERRGEFSEVGGIDLPAELLGSLPHALFTVNHAQIVKEKAQARALIEAANETLRDGYGNRFTAPDLADRARERIEALGVDRGPGGVVLVRLADVVSEPIEWLWPGRFATGKVNLLVGDPGLGKSFVTLGIAAAVSVGAPWPDLHGECAPLGSTVLLSAEDALGDTIRPRLDAAGADLSKIHAITAIRKRNGKLASFSLKEDLHRLEETLGRLGDARLVVIDPVSAYLGGADEHKNAEIRSLAGPLKEMAERHKVAVLLVTHPNKGTGTKAVYRSTGSLAFVAAARLAWLFIKDKDDPLRRLILPVKTNILAEPTGMAYRIVDGVIQWEAEPVRMHADDALAAEGTRGERKDGEGTRGPAPAKIRAAMDWLKERLANGPARHGEVREAFKETGYSVDTFYTAIRRLGVNTELLIDGKKHLELPPAETPDGGDEGPDTIPIF